jgi:hypothetical protein
VVDDDGAPVTADRLPTLPRQQALATLGIYFRTVNGGDFPSAVAQLVHPPSLASFTAGVASSQNSDFAASVLSESADEIVVWVRFTSRQDPGKGPAGRPQETCTDWSLDYVLAPANGLWLIDRTRPHEGEPNRPCAAA